MIPEEEEKPRTRVTLYRCTCKHCDSAEEELKKLSILYGAVLEVQRVEQDARLRGFAGWSTPIVAVDGVGLTHYKVDVKAWEKAIKTRSGARASELTGVVVDMCCYFKRGARPAGHEKCAQECFAAGGPVGLSTIDGRVYLALPDKRDPAAFEKLKEFPEREVKVTGEIRLRDGLAGIMISEVRPI